MKQLNTQLRYDARFSDNVEAYAERQVMTQLVSDWYKEHTENALILFRPTVILSTTEPAELRKSGYAHCTGLALDATKAQVPKPIDMDEVSKLCSEFAKKHAQNPTHILVPPGHSVTLPGDWLRDSRPLTLEPNPIRRTNTMEFFGLQVVPNAPMLAVAIL
jgi:hypothetical protein